jgi:hypothetical protein
MGGKVMKSREKMEIKLGSIDEFFARAKEHAQMLDRGELPPKEFLITFEDASDMERMKLSWDMKQEETKSVPQGLKPNT